MLYYIGGTLRCELYLNCTEFNQFTIANLRSFDIGTSLLFLSIAMLFEFLFFVVAGEFRLEISPEKYRARFQERINGLRAP